MQCFNCQRQWYRMHGAVCRVSEFHSHKWIPPPSPCPQVSSAFIPGFHPSLWFPLGSRPSVNNRYCTQEWPAPNLLTSASVTSRWQNSLVFHFLKKAIACDAVKKKTQLVNQNRPGLVTCSGHDTDGDSCRADSVDGNWLQPYEIFMVMPSSQYMIFEFIRSVLYCSHYTTFSFVIGNL